MLKIDKHITPSAEQWEIIIEGMRNPMNSWDKMDSQMGCSDKGGTFCTFECVDCDAYTYNIGDNDLDLMNRLNKAGSDHRKYKRMIPVWVTVTAPLYWWKEFDTYKVGTVANSCSTMHKIHAKEFEWDDFSFEQLLPDEATEFMKHLVDGLNFYRVKFLETKDKKYWWQLIQLLPSSYNQKRTLFLNYEVLSNIYRARRNHKLDEWHTFCDFIKTLPYSELITGGDTDV